MAKVKKKTKKVVEYQLTLSQEEFNLVSGIVHDLGGAPDNPFAAGRKVAMYYGERGDKVLAFPRPKTEKILRGIAIAMIDDSSIDAVYEKWWQEKPLDSEVED